jgi:hypothetical protein
MELEVPVEALEVELDADVLDCTEDEVLVSFEEEDDCDEVDEVVDDC